MPYSDTLPRNRLGLRRWLDRELRPDRQMRGSAVGLGLRQGRELRPGRWKLSPGCKLGRELRPDRWQAWHGWLAGQTGWQLLG